MELALNAKQRRAATIVAAAAAPLNYLVLALLPITMFGLLAIAFTSSEHEVLTSAAGPIFTKLCFVLALFVPFELFTLLLRQRLIARILSFSGSFSTLMITLFYLNLFSGMVQGHMDYLDSPSYRAMKSFNEANKEFYQKAAALRECRKESRRRAFEVRMAMASSSSSKEQLRAIVKDLPRMCAFEAEEMNRADTKFDQKLSEANQIPAGF